MGARMQVHGYAVKVELNVLHYFRGPKKYLQNTSWKFRYALTLNYPNAPYYF